jgi:predicted  nucleic acid-binding Zn-ribbon protein
MINPEITELREKYETLQSKYELLNERLSRAEGRVSDAAKQTIWQFVVFMVGIGGLIVGLVNYQTNVLDKRFDAVNRHIEQGQKDLGVRLERVERNLDELNKELRARRN